jgi:hypothetical protein
MVVFRVRQSGGKGMTGNDLTETGDNGRSRFIRVWGYIFFAVVACSLYTLYVASALNYPISHRYFGVTVGSWHLLTGIGLFVRRKWGYYLFKLYLYILIVSFPIGTIISYKCLKYIRENNVKRLFIKG